VLGVVLLAAGIGTAQAEDRFADRPKCIRENTKVFGEVNAKRICDPKNFVSDPNEYGWNCTEGRVKGSGAKQKNDMICE